MRGRLGRGVGLILCAVGNREEGWVEGRVGWGLGKEEWEEG